MAIHTFAHRELAVQHEGSIRMVYAWDRTPAGAGARYRINRTHPLVHCVLSQSHNIAPLIESMLRLLEQTVPVQRIWLNAVKSGEIPHAAFADAETNEIESILEFVYLKLTFSLGLSNDRACCTGLSHLTAARPWSMPIVNEWARIHRVKRRQKP